MGGYNKLLLDAGLSSPGGLRSLETSGTSSRIQAVARQCLLGNEVMAHSAFWRWSVAMACSHVVEEGSTPGTQEMHDRGNDECVVLGSYLVLHSLNQFIQICCHGIRSLYDS